jgi:serine/threonine protein kinase
LNSPNILAPAPTSAQSGADNGLPVGTRLADYEITGMLGEGGFGIVYLAFDHALHRTVAIKEYMPAAFAGRASDGSVVVRAERHAAAFAAGLKSFINEARLLAQFDHPSLVKVYLFREQNQTAYMVMRHYQGQTLGDIIKNRPEIISEAWLKLIFKPILEVLAILNQAKILHRDVSPDNIIVQKNGEAVLLDCGSARQIIGDMTQGLTVILKPGYAPLEQYSDDGSVSQGPWTDIYALAAVMYFAILKKPPPSSIARIVKDSLVPLQSDDAPGYSPKFLQAVNQGLALHSHDRPQSMDEFRRLLGISVFESARKQRSASTIHGSESSDGDELPILAPPASPPGRSPISATPLTGEGPFQPISPPAHPSALPIGGWFKQLTPRAWAISAAVLLLGALALYFMLRSPGSQTSPKPDQTTVADTKTQGAASAAPKLHSIKILIKPWGTVFVDGVEMGVSPPLKTLNLTEGRHKIRVSNPGFRDFVHHVNISQDKPKALDPISHEFTIKAAPNDIIK